MLTAFYNKLQKNLNSDLTFYRYYQETYKYNQIKIFYKKFLNVLSFLPKKRKKIFILSEKSFELYATSISIVLSNNIWVPISNSSPYDRIINMINTTKPDFFFFDNYLSIKNKRIKNFLKKNKIQFADFKTIKEAKEINKIPIINYKDDDTSMIFFTSGSTGVPKGVPISHKNYIFSLKAQIKNLYKNKNQLIFADFHDISFVISLNILFPVIYTKSTIVPGIKNEEIVLPINSIKKNKINTFVTVPSNINRIKKFLINKKLKILVLCGEPFYLDLCNFIIKKKLTEELYNCYGSTELSPWVFSHKCNISDIEKYRDHGLVPIGKKYSFVKIKIQENQLLIGGASLIKTYLNKIDNKNKFCEINGTRYYKSNDLVKKSNNNYIITGRNDNVVKIFGFRVDLNEINLAIRKMKNVREVFTYVNTIGEYQKQIIVAIETNLYKTKYFEKELKKQMPKYMLPKQIKLFKKFPRNKNGKIDRLQIKNLD